MLPKDDHLLTPQAIVKNGHKSRHRRPPLTATESALIAVALVHGRQNFDTALNFDIAFATFFRGIEQLASNDPETVRFEMDVGPRYIRIARVYKDYRTLHCFVDRTNGEVLRGSWKQPRHTQKSRGNIFDANNGLGSMGKYGAAYLR